jgi:2-dehydro-3-deoxy-D-arabinonate dehydratase
MVRICRYMNPETNRPTLGAVSEDGWIHRLGTDTNPFPDMDEWLARPDALEFARAAVSRALESSRYAKLGVTVAVPEGEGEALPFVPEQTEGGALPVEEGESSLRRMDVNYMMERSPVSPLAPLQNQEVWGAGVTYERSKVARMEESVSGGSFYDLVYSADRPELFLKSTPRRVVHPGQPIRIREDSGWDVPEPELACVVSASGEIVGYTVGDDVSSRSIEGENPLYLPQAKIYRGSCSLGPVITLAGEGGIEEPRELLIQLQIQRGSFTAFEGEVSTSRMRRDPQELVDYLFREDDFPNGVLLLTGTGIVPPDEFTLHSGDLVMIKIERIGILANPVA